MNNERMIAVSSDLIERAVSLLDLLPESGTIIQLRAALATQPAEQWIACSDRLPEVAEGCQQEFIVCAKHNQSGKVVVMSALYLNAYPLYCDYDDDEADEDGNIPHTGWYDAKSNGDDANCYTLVNDSWYGSTVTHWMPMPAPAAMRAQAGEGGE